MSVDGTYKIVIESPLGAQEVKFNLKARGAVLEGNSESSMGKTTFIGKVNGDEVSWDSKINGPMGEMALSFKGQVKGNDFSGEVRAGNFGTYPFKGQRV